MADTEHSTMPPPTWSFGDLPPRPGDTSPQASRASATADEPTVSSPTWASGDIPAHYDDASAEASLRASTCPPEPRPSPSATGPFDKVSSPQPNASADAPTTAPMPTETAFDAGATQAAPSDETYEDVGPNEQPEPGESSPEQPDPGRYRTRTCRICFDEVAPTFESMTPAAQLLRQKPRVVYISDDPDCGRLMRPCKCKGTQQYVHEGCLRAWRMAAGADRNLWKCPTCLYEYRLNRLSWGAWVSSTTVRVGLTLLVLVLAVFLLGFVADPVMRYLNPASLMSDYVFGFDDFEELEVWIPDGQPNTWSWHFVRGFFALGVAGVFKTVLLWRPMNIIRIGGGGRRRGGGGGGGRDRVENIQLAMVLIGVVVFLRVSYYLADKWNSRVLTPHRPSGRS